MHSVTGRWRIGLVLSLSTALLWGVLPMALKALLGELDAWTIVWYRFVAALVFLWLWLRVQRKTPNWKTLDRKVVFAILVAVAGLIGNYVCYLVAIDYISPAGAQTLIQMAPMLFLLGSVYFFKESFNRWQKAGFLIFVGGLVLFFNQRIALFHQQADFVSGLFWMIAASITWAAYALAQKQLLKSFSSPEILLMIYLVASVVLLPFAHSEHVHQLTHAGWYLLIFACLNTLLAYGAFAEALVHWEGSRVSATLAITPLITIFSCHLLNYFWPGSIATEPLNAWSYAGAGLVVAGSMVTALKR